MAPKRLGRNFWWFSIAATLLAFGLGLIGSFVAPAFESVFQSFGGSLPQITALLLASRHALWLPTALILVLWLWSWKTRSDIRARKTLQALYCALMALELVFYPVIVDALYKPIFNMGATGAAPAGN